MKKPFDQTVVGRLLIGLGKIVAGMVIKNQKGIKNTPNEKRIDDLIDKIP